MKNEVIAVAIGPSKKERFISINGLEMWCKEHYMGLFSESLNYCNAPYNEALVLLDEVKCKRGKDGQEVILNPGKLVAKLNKELHELPFIEDYFIHLLENNVNNLLPLNDTSLYDDLVCLREEDVHGARVIPYTCIKDVTPTLMVNSDISLEILFMFKTVVYINPLINGAGLSMTMNFDRLKDSLVLMELKNYDLSGFDFKEHRYTQRIFSSYGRGIITESHILSRLSKQIEKLKPP